MRRNNYSIICSLRLFYMISSKTKFNIWLKFVVYFLKNILTILRHVISCLLRWIWSEVSILLHHPIFQVINHRSNNPLRLRMCRTRVGWTFFWRLRPFRGLPWYRRRLKHETAEELTPACDKKNYNTVDSIMLRNKYISRKILIILMLLYID